MRPTVSVLIDTYNHERFIEQAIASVLEQDALEPGDEIVVVDDGSTDRTAEIVRRFVPRIRFIEKSNGGQASAFNAGLPRLRGEIIAMLDGDDWWARDKLRRVLETFQQNPDVGIVGHGNANVDANGAILSHLVPDRTYRLDLRTLESARLFDELKCFLGTSKVAYRRSVLERIFPVPEELIFEADEYLWTVGAALADIMVLDQELFYYRHHDSNFFMSAVASDAEARRRYQVMACLWRELPPRMAALGVAPDVIVAALASLRLDTESLRLRVDGGWPWETFALERAIARRSYRRMSFGYRAFKAFSLALTLLLPPKTYLRLKRWYGARGLRRYRGVLGEPTPRAQTVERKVVT